MGINVKSIEKNIEAFVFSSNIEDSSSLNETLVPLR